jgi:hypothetical protein
VEEDFVRTAERWGNDEAAATVVERGDAERWQDDGGRGFFLDGLEGESSGEGRLEDAADVGEGGSFVGTDSGRR